MDQDSIQNLKASAEALLPPPEKVIERNKAVTGQYARMYERSPELLKWAGMAAFASYHIGMSLIPFKWVDIGIVDLTKALEQKEKGFRNDLQLIRLLNNHIFNDIGWVHLAYLDSGIELLRSLFTNHPHYGAILKAFEKIEEGKCLLETDSAAAEELIWQANTEILWHEQSAVVQPVFNKLGPAFSRAMSICASFDYKVSHIKTDWRTHSSFVLFMLYHGFDKVRKTGFLPVLTNLDHRWYWIENRLLGIWRETDKTDPQLANKIMQLEDLYMIDR